MHQFHQDTAISDAMPRAALCAQGGELFFKLTQRDKLDAHACKMRFYERVNVPGKTVIAESGMMEDRASIVFASPAEINSFIKEVCSNEGN